ncbi:MAG: hypothetical protein AAB019_09050 [Planctomycetota bacterium]
MNNFFADKKIIKRQGYSLLEVLLVIGMIALITEAVVGIFIISLKDWENKDIRADLMTDAQFIMTRLADELKLSEKVTLAAEREIEFFKPAGLSAATNQGVFRYQPDKNTWENITGNLPGGNTVLSLLLSSDKTLFAGTDQGAVYKTTDLGRTWSATAPLTGVTRVNCLLETPDKTIYTGTSPNGNILKTTDGGTSWTDTANLSKNGADVSSIFALTVDNQNTIYAGASYTQNANIFKTTNGGTTWTDGSLFTDWWNTAYSYKQQLQITNISNQTLGAGYTVKLLLDHYGLAQAGQSLTSGNDVRIIYWNGSTYVELDRFNETTWNRERTLAIISFKTQSAIPPGGADSNYFLYYGNSSAAAPPANPQNVYLFWDDFSTGLDTVNTWDILGTPDINSGRVTLDTGEAIATKATYSKTMAEVVLRWNSDGRTVGWGWINNISATTPPFVMWYSRSSDNFYAYADNNAGDAYLGVAVLSRDDSEHIWQIAWTTNNIKWYYDRDALDRTTAVDYSVAQPLVIKNVNSRSFFVVDSVRIKQYVYPEPSVTRQGEEIQRANNSVLSLATDSTGNIIYAGTNLIGDVHKSSDRGAIWSVTANLAEGATNAENVFDLWAEPEGNDDSIYAATSPNGNIFKTTNDGFTWVNTGNLTGATEVRTLLAAPDGTLYAGTLPNGDVFMSLNHGQNWTNTSNIPAATAVSALAPVSEKVKYFWSGVLYNQSQNPNDWLQRRIISGIFPLENGTLKNFRLEYFKEDYTPADTSTQTGRDLIKLIGITVTLEKKGLEYTLQNTVRTRY